MLLENVKYCWFGILKFRLLLTYAFKGVFLPHKCLILSYAYSTLSWDSRQKQFGIGLFGDKYSTETWYKKL